MLITLIRRAHAIVDFRVYLIDIAPLAAVIRRFSLMKITFTNMAVCCHYLYNIINYSLKN